MVEKQRTAGSGQRTEKEGKSLQNKELENVEIFLFFSDFGRGYLREWPKRSSPRKPKDTKKFWPRIFTSGHEEFLDAGLRGTCLVFFFYIVINWFGSVLAAIAGFF